ncbi:MAG: solute:sodium symporter family transporter [Rubripirellula sp.]|nr:solute:sodium symporter family transporter [Rubripirellula sp.]
MLTLLSFVFFTALVGLLTFWIVRGKEHASTDGYFLAGRSLTAGVIAGSLLLTNLSTEQLVGLNGAAFRDGLAVMAWEVIAGLSLVLMAIFFLPRYLARGITTIPEYLAGRFDDTTRAITNAIFIIAYAAILLPIILYTGARGLSGILDLQGITGIESDQVLLWIVVWMIGIIGSIYAIFGGLRTVAISDTINGFGLLIGGLMIMWLGLQLVGDGDAMGGWREMRDANPEKFNSLGESTSSVPWPTLFTGVALLNLFYWTTNQQIIQRTFAARSLAEGQKGVLLAAMFKILAPMILVLPGMMAFYLDQQGTLFEATAEANLLSGAEDALAELIDEQGEQGLAGKEPEVWLAEEVQSRKADRSYGILVRKVLPKQFAGFFAAVMVGAILSSFNSALNATATLFSLGIFRRYLRPNADEHSVVKSGQWFGTAIAVVAMTVAPLLAGQDSIFGYLQKMNGLYFIPIFSVVLMGMLNRRVPAWAANLALFAGFATIALGYFVFGSFVDQLHEFHFLGLVFAVLVGLMYFASIASPRELSAEQEEQAAPAPIPMDRWKPAVPVGAALATVVVAIYLYFAFA